MINTVSLGPAQLDLTGVRAGDRNQIQLTLTVAGQPFDLTDTEVTAEARTKSTDEGPATLTAEVTITDATAGTVSLAWPGEEVRTALAGSANWTGVWDLQVASPGTDPLTVVAGKLKAEQDVTK
jgi:hypothetical protein